MDDLISYSPQLYLIKDRSATEIIKIEPWASSVLVYYKAHFLVTAKHVLDGIKLTDLGIYTAKNDGEILNGEIWYHPNNSDNIDVAAIKLEPQLTEKLESKYQFLSLDCIGLGHSFEEDDLYVLFGYPYSQTKENRRKKEFHIKPLKYTTNHKSLRNIEKMGFNNNDNILFDYRIRDQYNDDTGLKEKGPKNLKGMSGGGVWFLDTEDEMPELVAIMTHERTDRGIVIATKLDRVFEILKGNSI